MNVHYSERVRRRAAVTVLLITALILAAGHGGAASRFRAEEGRYLRGADQHRQLREALSAAHSRILVVMYLMVSSEVAGHPVLTLIRDLEAAQARDVDVLVILDDHLAEKNAVAVRQLKELGIDVRFDGEDRITHTKLVVADDDVFVGSANWSALALTGGNIESTVRVRNRGLADLLYKARIDHLTTAEIEALGRIERVFLAEARETLQGATAGGLRRDLTAGGVDADALIAAGVGWIPPDDTAFRAAVLAGAGVGEGWARWGLPDRIAGLLVIPSPNGAFALVDPTTWRLVSGDVAQDSGVFKAIRERLRP